MLYRLKMGDLYFVGWQERVPAWTFEFEQAATWPRHVEAMTVYQHFLDRNPDMRDVLCIIMSAPVAPAREDGANDEPQAKAPEVGA